MATSIFLCSVFLHKSSFQLFAYLEKTTDTHIERKYPNFQKRITVIIKSSHHLSLFGPSR